jgi:hypothetical protein
MKIFHLTFFTVCSLLILSTQAIRYNIKDEETKLNVFKMCKLAKNLANHFPLTAASDPEFASKARAVL